MARFLLVKAEALPGLPKAFQDFVGDHFAKKVVGEMEYFYAFCWVGQPGKTTKGNAPGHSVDTGHYRGGLKDGQSLWNGVPSPWSQPRRLNQDAK